MKVPLVGGLVGCRPKKIRSERGHSYNRGKKKSGGKGKYRCVLGSDASAGGGEDKAGVSTSI